MKISKTIAAVLAVLWFVPVPAAAGADNPVTGSVSVRELAGERLVVTVSLPDAVPYRVFTLEAPRRLVLDFQDVVEFELPDGAVARGLLAMRSGTYRAGWTRIVADLDLPLVVESAALMQQASGTGQGVEIVLKTVNSGEFARRSSVLSGVGMAEPVGDQKQAGRRSGGARVLVALDPGHGGIDPGAHRGDITEKDIALKFAGELRAQLQATGRFNVILTRDDDTSISLRDRVALSRRAGAALMISLHANTVTKGRASGAAIYVLGEAPGGSETAALAAFENSVDSLSGVSLGTTESDIVRVLSDMARLETNARSVMLADTMLRGLRVSVGVIRSRPSRAGEFRILQAPDMPSVLLELGFLSDEGDRAKLTSPQWHRLAAQGIVQALDIWVAQDARAARLARQ